MKMKGQKRGGRRMRKRTFLVVFAVLALFISGFAFLNASGQAGQKLQPEAVKPGENMAVMKTDARADAETEEVPAPADQGVGVKPGFRENANDGWICPISGLPAGSGAAGICRNFTGTMMDMIAEELGMTWVELRAERFAGKSLGTIAEEKGMSLEELKASIMKNREKVLEELVKDGTISEAEKQALVQLMESRLETAMERFETAPANGRGLGEMKGYGRPGADDNQSFRQNRRGNCFR